MGFKDILLQLGSYPEPTPPEAIDQAVAFVAAAGGALSALAVHVDIRAPRNRVANLLIGLNKLCEAEEEKSLHAARAILADFSTKAGAAGLLGQALLGQANVYGVGDYVAARARTRDLCLVPTDDYLDGQRSVAEAVVFGSGRPVLVFRPGRVDLPAKLDVVTLAWDGSRAAARAMADALPLLRRAGTVKVVTVINEKPDAEHGIGDPAVRHLAAHGVNAVAEECDAGGGKIGEILTGYAAGNGSSLIVMGAYGRSRVREFILGGATESMLHNLKTPLLLSH